MRWHLGLAIHPNPPCPLSIYDYESILQSDDWLIRLQSRSSRLSFPASACNHQTIHDLSTHSQVVMLNMCDLEWFTSGVNPILKLSLSDIDFRSPWI
jgi:hypothetical protein